MSEPKPTYDFREGVLEAAIVDQMRTLHSQYQIGRQSGEFTIQEYADAVGTTYERGKQELHKAIEDGKVYRRLNGSRSYYKLAE